MHRQPQPRHRRLWGHAVTAGCPQAATSPVPWDSPVSDSTRGPGCSKRAAVPVGHGKVENPSLPAEPHRGPVALGTGGAGDRWRWPGHQPGASSRCRTRPRDTQHVPPHRASPRALPGIRGGRGGRGWCCSQSGSTWLCGGCAAGNLPACTGKR